MNGPEDTTAPPVLQEPFVGRQHELEELLTELHRALVGQGRLMMLIGEPGIGKTRTAEEVASIAAAEGAFVAWGRCWEGEGAPVYWPWVQVIRTLLEGANQDALWSASAADAAAIAQIVPEAGAGLALPAIDPTHDPAQSRFRLFDAVARYVRTVATHQPLVLVLDDLHWADTPSLLLLQFLARGLRSTRVVVICTYRDREIGLDSPLLPIMGQLARESSRILLGGLSRREVGQVIHQVTGVVPPSKLVTAVYTLTEGNPFFVSEVVRLLTQQEGIGSLDETRTWALPVPQGIREIIGAHLSRLSDRCNCALQAASVLGREFDAALLERVTSLPRETLMTTLQEAVDGHIIATTGEKPNVFQFSHAVTRETVYSGLEEVARANLHREAGEALASLPGADVASQLAGLAHHFLKAVPVAGAAKAVTYAVRAAEEADRRLAFEEAGAYFERALSLLQTDDHDRRRYAELLLALGDVRSKAGGTEQARDAFQAAAAAGRDLDDPLLIGRAALGYGGRFVGLTPGFIDQPLVSLLEEALKRLDSSDSGIRATLLARLCRARYYAEPYGERLDRSREALAMAERVGDTPAQISALNSVYWALGRPEDLSRRLETATEMARLAHEVGDKEMTLQAHHWRLVELAAVGDMAKVDAEIDAYTRLATELRQPLYTWYAVQFRLMRALMVGQFDICERLARQALETVENVEPSLTFRTVFDAQMLWLLWEQGWWREAEETFRTLPPLAFGDLGGRAALACAGCRLGWNDEMRADFVSLMTDHDLEHLPRDLSWLGMVANLAEACFFLRETGHAETLYELLLPYADRNVVIGGAVACRGSAAHFLGLLAVVSSRWGDATRHFEDALDMNLRMGAKALAVHTRYEYARMMVESGQTHLFEKARRLLEETTVTARGLDMAGVVERAQSVISSLQRGPKGVTRVRGGENVFRREGDSWIVRFEGTSLRFKDVKGLNYLARLLREPGREIHVTDIAGAATILHPSDGGVLDAQARSEYQSRFSDLQAELEEAQLFSDLGRVESIQKEMDFFTNELKAAYGLGGRPRKSAVEDKARKAVTNRIRASIERLKDEHPRLGQHLDNSVKTGTFCSYTPEETIHWQL